MSNSTEIEIALRRHVLEAWFPRCIDREGGGFFCDFDRRWRSCGPQEKLLEFQARQTLTAADACRAYPSEQRYRDAAIHGLRYLSGALWDPAHGGWYHRLDRGGRPLENGTKHTHGAAYALEACAAVHRALGDTESLALARDAFEWIERHARDHRYGGYFGFLTREGVPILTVEQVPSKLKHDPLGTPVGVKDLNVHSDLLETFVALHAVWPVTPVADRIDEMTRILIERMMCAATGALHYYVTNDWHPIPHLVRAGYQFQSAFRLLTARGMGIDDRELERAARAMTEVVVREMYDRHHGGFLYAAPSCQPSSFFDRDLRVPYKSWWVQVEALRALLAMSELDPGDGRWRRYFEEQWRHVARHYFDETYGGIYSGGLDMLNRARRKLGARAAPAALTRKGDQWKDASHDGRALLFCVETLRAFESPSARTA